VMSVYIKAYELCGDVLHDDDPRRSEIVAEMKAVEKAATIDEAAAVVEWWGWGRRADARHKTAKDFCEDVRRFLARALLEGGRAMSNSDKPIAWVQLGPWLSGIEWPGDCFAAAESDIPDATPLYLSPTLTEDEREAVELSRDFCEAQGERRLADVLSGLLARSAARKDGTA